jgi:photosystem II biogenesis protein Psp29
VTNNRTVSDSKRTFYSLHTRPINSIYRRVVDELMVEMHLLMVNADYAYSPIYALGVVSAYDRFMNGYRPDADRASIFSALCKSVECDAQAFRKDADDLLSAVEGLSWDALVAGETGGALQGAMAAVAGNPKFKYSRLFAIGVYTLLDKLDPEKLKDKDVLSAAILKVSQALNLSPDKVQKDLELYQSNLEKMIAAQNVMADILAADRKKRDQREQERAAKLAAEATPESAEDNKNEMTSV